MYSFKKEERLCNVKLIEKLFTDGSSFLVYPFRIVWLSELSDSVHPVQVLISVPKKRFKRAVDRNLIKRRIREVYRLHKSEYLYPFLNEHSAGLILGITYIGNEIGEYAFLDKKFKDALNRFKKLYLSNHVEKDS
ncbi:MAG: ribonuclease P protein component [Pedobacter sp.]|nr:ribonuclease P protein component [Pedobacter sp.]